MRLIKTILIIYYIFNTNDIFSQKHSFNLDDLAYFSNQKNHNFIIGDTIYVWARHDKHLWNNLYFYYSPLLDSLAISLKKNPDIALVIKG